MAALAVFMMIAVSFTPIVALIADDQGSDAAVGDISAYVKDANGVGIDGITVTLTGATGYTPTSTTCVTSSGGQYTFAGAGTATTNATITATNALGYTFASTQTITSAQINTGVSIDIGTSTIAAAEYTGSGTIQDAGTVNLAGIIPTVTVTGSGTNATAALISGSVTASNSSGVFKFVYTRPADTDSGTNQIVFTATAPATSGFFTFNTTGAGQTTVTADGTGEADNVVLSTPLKAVEYVGNGHVYDKANVAISGVTPTVAVVGIGTNVNATLVSGSVSATNSSGQFTFVYTRPTDTTAGNSITFTATPPTAFGSYTFGASTGTCTAATSGTGNNVALTAINAVEYTVSSVTVVVRDASGSVFVEDAVVKVYADDVLVNYGVTNSSGVFSATNVVVEQTLSVYVFCDGILATGTNDETISDDSAQSYAFNSTTKTYKITGTVSDGSTPAQSIDDATITYTVDGVTKTVLSDAGNYTILVAEKSNVVITKVEATGYTFPAQSVDLGSITSDRSSTTYNQLKFVATEKTASGTVAFAYSAGGVVSLLDGTTVTATWYIQTYTPASGTVAQSWTYAVASTGSASVVSVADNGTFKVSYVCPTIPDVPSGAVAGTTNTAWLLVSGSTNGVFTFDVGTPVQSATSAWNADNYAGSTWTSSVSISTSVGAIKTMQKVSKVTVNDASANEVTGLSINAIWYSGRIGSTTYTSTGASASVISNSVGNFVAYYIQPNTGAAKDYALQVSGINADGYTFDVKWVVDPTTFVLTKGAGIAYEGQQMAAGTVAVPMTTFPSFGTFTIAAKESTVTVGGVVANSGTPLVGVVVNYKTTAGSFSAVTTTGGAYSIKVAAGQTLTDISVDVSSDTIVVNNVSVPNPVKGFVFTPESYNLGVVSASRSNCNFNVGAPSSDVTVTLTGLKNTEDVTVTLQYSGYISGTLTVQSNKQTAVGFSIQNIPAGATMTYVVTAPGYSVAKVNATTFEATKYMSYKIVTYSDAATVAPYTTIKYTLSDIGGSVVTDASGMASITYLEGAAPVLLVTPTANTPVVIDGVTYNKLVSSTYVVSYVDLRVSYMASYFDDSTDLIDPQTSAIAVGQSVTLTAPSFDGYEFVGWYIGGVQVGTAGTYTYTAVSSDVSASSVDVGVSAVYSVDVADLPDAPGISDTVIILCVIAVILAIVGLALAVVGSRKK